MLINFNKFESSSTPCASHLVHDYLIQIIEQFYLNQQNTLNFKLNLLNIMSFIGEIPWITMTGGYSKLVSCLLRKKNIRYIWA